MVPFAAVYTEGKVLGGERLLGDPEMRFDNLIDFAHLLCYTFLVTTNMRRDMESG